MHHRYIEFSFLNSDLSTNRESDFSKYYYYLGDRRFHWNSYALRKERSTNGYYSKSSETDLSKIYYFVPLPFASIDEYRYIYGARKDTTLYDKNYLIKGRVGIKGKGDGVYNERYRSKRAEVNGW